MNWSSDPGLASRRRVEIPWPWEGGPWARLFWFFFFKACTLLRGSRGLTWFLGTQAGLGPEGGGEAGHIPGGRGGKRRNFLQRWPPASENGGVGREEWGATGQLVQVVLLPGSTAEPRGSWRTTQAWLLLGDSESNNAGRGGGVSSLTLGVLRS